jgi:hypothetical protein
MLSMNNLGINNIFIIVGVMIGIALLFLYIKVLRYKFFPKMIQEHNLGLSIVNNNKFKVEKLLLKGTKSSNDSFYYNTNIESKYDKKRSYRYIRIPPSVNVKGGAQFTYNFWINKKTNNVKNSVIFEKGTTKINPSPRVRFGSEGDGIVIEIATKKGGLQNFSIDSDKLSLLNSNLKDWYMITIILEDYYNEDNFETGIKMSFYLNDNLIDSSFRLDNDTIQFNNDKFVLFPQDKKGTSLTGVDKPDIFRISNLRYFNYAISMNQIRKLYNQGPDLSPGIDLVQQINKSTRETPNIYELSLQNHI